MTKFRIRHVIIGKERRQCFFIEEQMPDERWFKVASKSTLEYAEKELLKIKEDSYYESKVIKECEF